MNAVFWDVTPCGSCKNKRFLGIRVASGNMMEAIRSSETRFLQESHGVTSQKTVFTLVTVVKTT
jgi:hypothetical protein